MGVSKAACVLAWANGGAATDASVAVVAAAPPAAHHVTAEVHQGPPGAAAVAAGDCNFRRYRTGDTAASAEGAPWCCGGRSSSSSSIWRARYLATAVPAAPACSSNFKAPPPCTKAPPPCTSRYCAISTWHKYADAPSSSMCVGAVSRRIPLCRLCRHASPHTLHAVCHALQQVVEDTEDDRDWRTRAPAPAPAAGTAAAPGARQQAPQQQQAAQQQQQPPQRAQQPSQVRGACINTLGSSCRSNTECLRAHVKSMC